VIKAKFRQPVSRREDSQPLNFSLFQLDTEKNGID